MGTIGNAPDAFEQMVKESLEHFEVPYNSSDWDQLERSLNGGRAARWGRNGLAAALILGLLAAGGTTWYLTHRTTEAPRTGDTAQLAPTQRTTPPNDAALNGTGAPTEQAATLPATAPQETAAARPEHHAAAAHATPVKAATAEPLHVTPAPAPKEPLDPMAGAPKPENAFRTSVSEGCPGTSVDFKVEHMPEDGIYLWNFGDGSFSNKPNPEHTFSKPGSYQVMLSMSAAGVGTIHNKPSSDVIMIHEAPQAAFNVLKQEYDGHLPSVHFENRSMAAKSYVWDFGDGETSTIPHPDHIYKKKGVYHVELTATNAIGCEDKAIKDVRIDKDYNLDAPSSFSPNGEGLEKTFIPQALRTLGVKFHLAIYDPNGALMYETTDATKPWLGKPNNRGEVCAAGDYVWVVDVRESLYLAETYTGKVTLVH